MNIIGREFDINITPEIKTCLCIVMLQLTLADLAVHEAFTDFLTLNPDALKDFPKLAANRKLVEQNENIKRYLAKRPKTEI